MKKIIIIATAQLCFFASLFFNSCALIDLEEEQKTVVDMHFSYDTIYVEMGDQFTITPVFDPDTVSIENIYWETSAEDVVSILSNTFTAVGEGWSTIRAISVSAQKEDSCHVCVLPKWSEVIIPVTPYETVVYASPEIDGKEFEPRSMVLIAYLGNEVAGLGQLKEQNGYKYIRLRVGSEIFDEEDCMDVAIKLKLYNRKDKTFKNISCSEYLPFDTESHGTPISPLILKTR